MPTLTRTEITAGNVHLRPFTHADIDRAYEICQDPDVQRWTAVPSPYARTDAETFVGQTAPQGWETGAEAIFAICDSTTGQVLGSVGLHLNRGGDDEMGEIGYLLAAEARNRGVMTTAAAAVCRWGFDALSLGRIEWYAQVGNHASKAVAEKVGFQIEGVLRNRLVHGGERVDAWVAGLLPADPRPVT